MTKQIIVGKGFFAKKSIEEAIQAATDGTEIIIEEGFSFPDGPGAVTDLKIACT